MALFSLLASCASAFKLQANRGGTWIENAAGSLIVIGLMALATGSIMCVWAFVEDRSPMARPKGDDGQPMLDPQQRRKKQAP